MEPQPEPEQHLALLVNVPADPGLQAAAAAIANSDWPRGVELLTAALAVRDAPRMTHWWCRMSRGECLDKMGQLELAFADFSAASLTLRERGEVWEAEGVVMEATRKFQRSPERHHCWPEGASPSSPGGTLDALALMGALRDRQRSLSQQQDELLRELERRQARESGRTRTPTTT